MENYILPFFRYILGNSYTKNNSIDDLNALEKNIDSPNYRDKYFNFSFNTVNNNILNVDNNNNDKLENNEEKENKEENIHQNVRKINDDYGNDFIIMI